MQTWIRIVNYNVSETFKCALQNRLLTYLLVRIQVLTKLKVMLKTKDISTALIPGMAYSRSCIAHYFYYSC